MEKSISGNKITTIIATAGRTERAGALRQAVRSIEEQTGAQASVLIIFNGPNVDEGLVREFERRDAVAVKRIDEGNLPKAIQYGRRCVDSEYFCFLDDDDEYLPGSLARRSAVLDNNPDVDVVVTNGLVKDGDKSWSLLPNELALERNPLEELFRQNWLASCGGMYRSKTVGEEYFRDDAKYYEWTMTAFLLSLDRSIKYLNCATFVINKTDESLSASIQYLEAYPGVLQMMRNFCHDSRIDAEIRRRLARSFHAISVAYLRDRRRGDAWRFHLRSLKSIYGLRYLPYTARLII